MANVGAFTKIEGISLLTPSGFDTVEFHVSFLHLHGQAGNLKIQYSSVKRIFMLPESHQHTIVVLKLDPPIQEGQTLYPHIVMQFESERVIHNILATSKLSGPKYTGPSHEVFARILQGCTKARIIRLDNFRNCQGGFAVKSYSNDEYGLLYPLKRSFFFLQKEPPIHILHKEIDYVEFEKHDAGGSNVQYFNLLIRLDSDSEGEHIFRNIHINEYHNLVDFLSLRGVDVRESQRKDGVAAVLHLQCIESEGSSDESDEEEEEDSFADPHLGCIENETSSRGTPLERVIGPRSTFGDDSDEEDSDFLIDEDDGGSPTDESGGEDSDASEDEQYKPKKRKLNPEPSAPEVFRSGKKPVDGDDEDGSNMTNQKKDQSALKRKRAGVWISPPHSGSEDFCSCIEKDDGSTDDSGGEDSDASGTMDEENIARLATIDAQQQ